MSPEPHYFFALWPSADQAQALAGRALLQNGRMGIRVSAPEDCHLTLAFLGALDAAQRERVLSLAGRIRAQGFTLRLDRLGGFPRSRILWLAPSRVPERLLTLVDRLGDALRDEGCAARPLPVFRPHLTLARGVSPPPGPLPVGPIEWHVRDFCLACSRPGPPYEIVARWKLSPTAPDLPGGEEGD